jgi:hypothetical protein
MSTQSVFLTIDVHSSGDFQRAIPKSTSTNAASAEVQRAYTRETCATTLKMDANVKVQVKAAPGHALSGFASIERGSMGLTCNDSSTASVFRLRVRMLSTERRTQTQNEICLSGRRKRRSRLNPEILDGWDFDKREAAVEQELPGTRAHQRTRLAFPRGGVQMFCDVANGTLFRSQRLLHQKTREHRGRGFVEPLFEKSIDLFFQIGRVIQTGKFKGLKCWDGGLLKIFPRGGGYF